MPSTDVALRNLKPTTSEKNTATAVGLHLIVPAAPSTTKLWRLSYRYLGKQKTIALDAYPAVSLAHARMKRNEAKKLLAQGTEPAQQATDEKLAKKHAHTNTFLAIADDFLAKVKKEGKADVTMTRKRWLIDFARPASENAPSPKSRPPEVLAVFQKVETRGVTKRHAGSAPRSAKSSGMRSLPPARAADVDPDFIDDLADAPVTETLVRELVTGTFVAD